jgi:hypothetical protein
MAAQMKSEDAPNLAVNWTSSTLRVPAACYFGRYAFDD